MRDIVCIMSQQEQVTVFPQVQGVNEFLIKRLSSISILEPGGSQSEEKPVFFIVYDLMRGEYDVDQVFAQYTGQDFS